MKLNYELTTKDVNKTNAVKRERQTMEIVAANWVETKKNLDPDTGEADTPEWLLFVEFNVVDGNMSKLNKGEVPFTHCFPCTTPGSMKFTLNMLEKFKFVPSALCDLDKADTHNEKWRSQVAVAIEQHDKVHSFVTTNKGMYVNMDFEHGVHLS